MLMPVARRTNRITIDIGLNMRRANDSFNPIRSSQQLNQATKYWKADEIVESASYAQTASGCGASTGLDGIEVFWRRVTQIWTCLG